MRTILVLCALATLSLPALADNGHCWTTSPADDTWTGADGSTYYVDRTDCNGAPVSVTGGCTFSFWIYEEANGLPGQQRGDPDHNDVAACTDGTRADTDVF
ncbi:MAG: hypothetical protein QOE90_1994 [Thermoplasmata archaeon]|jgi:hypothetical protein|nr:hypothetical protein [Thermoplasmata archaeon]